MDELLVPYERFIAFQPADFYLLESIPCQMIRAYTNQWMEQAARSGLKPLPLR